MSRCIFRNMRRIIVERVAERNGEPKVNEFNLPRSGANGEEEIVGFDVAVNETMRVNMLERV